MDKERSIFDYPSRIDVMLGAYTDPARPAGLRAAWAATFLVGSHVRSWMHTVAELRFGLRDRAVLFDEGWWAVTALHELFVTAGSETDLASTVESVSALMRADGYLLAALDEQESVATYWVAKFPGLHQLLAVQSASEGTAGSLDDEVTTRFENGAFIAESRSWQ